MGMLKRVLLRTTAWTLRVLMLAPIGVAVYWQTQAGCIRIVSTQSNEVFDGFNRRLSEGPSVLGFGSLPMADRYWAGLHAYIIDSGIFFGCIALAALLFKAAAKASDSAHKSGGA
jgi:hypothetical protein